MVAAASEAVQHLLAVNWKSSCKSRFGMARMPREYISRLYSLPKKRRKEGNKSYMTTKVAQHFGIYRLLQALLLPCP